MLLFDNLIIRFRQAAETVLPVRVSSARFRDFLTIKIQIRIYGMTYFDDKGEYWGNKTTPLIGAGLGGRLDARSVKIFADGALRSGGAAVSRNCHTVSRKVSYIYISASRAILGQPRHKRLPGY